MKLTINPDRIDLDEAYMQMAEVWAKRSKANRLQVGALIVKDEQIISDGYNGMPRGMEGDDEVCEFWWVDPDNTTPGYTGEMKTKPMLLHAESNALMKLAKNGGKGADGATLYTKYSPCPECSKLIKQAKIARVVYRHAYRLSEGVEMLRKLGVEVHQIPGPTITNLKPPVDPPITKAFMDAQARHHNWVFSHMEPGHQTEPIYTCTRCGKDSEVPVPAEGCTDPRG